MNSGLSCDASSCSLHCVSTSPLSSPFPELHSHNGVPSDFQHAIIYNSIRRARENLARVEAVIATLATRRAELDKFIRDHTGMVSAMRRFPNEILAEIFSRCVDPDAEFDPLRNGVWILGRVCQRWRAVALGTPELWRHFLLRETGEQDPLKPFLNIQLDRARSAPLFIRFSARRSIELMDVLLDVSSQWADVQLGSTELCNRFLNQDSHFPHLKRLEIYSYLPLLEGRTSSIDMVASLPALGHLLMDLEGKPFPRQLLLPWSQLRTCSVWQFRAVDILWILSLVSHDTHVSVFDSRLEPGLAAREFQIRSMRIGGLSTCELLSAMLLPNLEKFEIGWDESPDPSKAVISFLDASDCHLKYLSIPQTGYRSASLISILESPHVRDIVRLDICHVSGSMYIPFFLAELSKNGQLAPQLRTLAIRGDSRDMDEFNVLELLANRKPTIRRVLSWEFEERERDSVNDGLEVVVRDR